MTNPETISIDGAKAVIYRSAPKWEELPALAIGGIQFSSADAGADLLRQIGVIAKNEGFQALLGPLDGDTWHSYRLVYKSDGSAPFLMEPTSGEHDLDAFEKAGFKPVSQYISATAQLEDTLSDTPASVSGVTVENWDGENGEALIKHLFDMSTSSFAKNRFFTPIQFDDFLDIYKPLLPFIDKQHVLFARDKNAGLKGFLFGMPNMLAQDDKPSVILKTYASSMRGVGHLLADTYHRRAIDMGFETVIHALIHEDNTSRERSEMHKARVFRKYALMGCKI